MNDLIRLAAILHITKEVMASWHTPECLAGMLEAERALAEYKEKGTPEGCIPAYPVCICWCKEGKGA